MVDDPYFRLQFIVFALVSASFTNIYITQPVLPILQNEFAADMVLVSFSVSAVILGITISNLPFGFLADRLPIHPIILTGGILVALGGLVCAVTNDLWILITARLLQGLFIPALTTCLAAYLAKGPSGRAVKRGNGLIRFCCGARGIVRSIAWWLDTLAVALAVCFYICFESHTHCNIHRVSMASPHFK